MASVVVISEGRRRNTWFHTFIWMHVRIKAALKTASVIKHQAMTKKLNSKGKKKRLNNTAKMEKNLGID